MIENCKVDDCQKRVLLADITWLRSSLVSLLTLAEAENSPLTNKQVASICRIALNDDEGIGDGELANHNPR